MLSHYFTTQGLDKILCFGLDVHAGELALRDAFSNVDIASSLAFHILNSTTLPATVYMNFPPQMLIQVAPLKYLRKYHNSWD